LWHATLYPGDQDVAAVCHHGSIGAKWRQRERTMVDLIPFVVVPLAVLIFVWIWRKPRDS
jgi:hypothetical protein